MASHTIVLNPLNNFTLVSGDVYNFVGPLKGSYVVHILNRSSADLAVGLKNTVALTDPASYIIPAGSNQAGDTSYSLPIYGPTGVWVAGVGAISVALASI